MSDSRKFTPIPSDVLIEQINEEHLPHEKRADDKIDDNQSEGREAVAVAGATAKPSEHCGQKQHSQGAMRVEPEVELEIGARNTQEQYGFYETVSALQCHAGTLTSEQNLISHRLVMPYTAFVVVKSGTANFSLNNQHHEISASPNTPQCCLINVANETLFCRHLVQGQAVTKLTVRDIRPWLFRRLPKNKQLWLAQTADYQWQADNKICHLLEQLLTKASDDEHIDDCNSAHVPHRAVNEVFADEVLLIHLIDALWQGFCQHFASVIDGDVNNKARVNKNVMNKNAVNEETVNQETANQNMANKDKPDAPRHSAYQFDGFEGGISHRAPIDNKANTKNKTSETTVATQVGISTQGGNAPQAHLLKELSLAWQAGCRDVHDLSDYLNLSKRGLQRQLKKHIGITPKEWLIQKNMQYARQQLLVDGVSIKEVAYQCGYSQVANFTQAFKQYYHTTPARYVARYQNSLLL